MNSPAIMAHPRVQAWHAVGLRNRYPAVSCRLHQPTKSVGNFVENPVWTHCQSAQNLGFDRLMTKAAMKNRMKSKVRESSTAWRGHAVVKSDNYGRCGVVQQSRSLNAGY